MRSKGRLGHQLHQNDQQKKKAMDEQRELKENKRREVKRLNQEKKEEKERRASERATEKQRRDDYKNQRQSEAQQSIQEELNKLEGNERHTVLQALIRSLPAAERQDFIKDLVMELVTKATRNNQSHKLNFYLFPWYISTKARPRECLRLFDYFGMSWEFLQMHSKYSVVI
jgi:flagellar biosynthesis GTPase FlhF